MFCLLAVLTYLCVLVCKKGFLCKGQIKPKAVWARHRFSQKINKRICFVCCDKQKSKQKNTFVCFFERIYGASICFRINLTFSCLVETKGYCLSIIVFLYFNSVCKSLTKKVAHHKNEKKKKSASAKYSEPQAFLTFHMLKIKMFHTYIVSKYLVIRKMHENKNMIFQ